MRFVTNSEISALNRCARKWYLLYFRQLYPKGERISETRTIGILAHDALNELYSNNQDPVAAVVYLGEQMIAEQEEYLTDDAREALVAQVEQNIATLESSIEFARIIVEGYVEWLEEEGEDQHLTLLASESERWIQVPLESIGQPVALLGKLDARFQDERSGARVFMDHKVVGTFSDREKWAHLDTQFRHYGLIEYLTLLEQQVDQDEAKQQWTDGGILNMLRKVKRTSRSNPPFYKRKQVRHNLNELRNYFRQVSGHIGRIVQLEQMLDQGVDHQTICPPNPTRDCTWDCAFMTLCAFMDDGSDAQGFVDASFNIGNPLKRYDTVTGIRMETGL